MNISIVKDIALRMKDPSHVQKQLSYAIALQKTPHLEDILQSLMHMHCNRILGINLLLEKKSYLYAYQALSAFSLHNHIKNV